MKIKTAVLLAATGLALAACNNKSEEQPAAETNVTNIVTEPENVTDLSADTEMPAPSGKATTAAAAPPSATLTSDQQTAEDADATGMTARVNRDETSNSGQPAQ